MSEKQQPSRPLRRFLLRVVPLVVAGYFLLVLLCFLFQRKLQYFPSASPVPLPRGGIHGGLEEMETVTADGVRLYGWYWPGRRPLTLLIFHGNAGHRGHRLGWLEEDGVKDHDFEPTFFEHEFSPPSRRERWDEFVRFWRWRGSHMRNLLSPRRSQPPTEAP